MQKDHTLVKHLQSVTIHALCEVKGPVQLKTISQDGHLEQALSLMSENNILSLPVKLEEHSLDYVGFIDVLDVIFFIIQTCTEGKNLEEAQWSSWCQDIHTLSHRGIRFGLKRIKALMDASNKDHWNPVSPSGTLSQLIEVFAAGVHRVPVVDSLGVVTNIVSQSDIVRFISEHITTGHPFDQTVQQLNLGTREVIDMSSSAQTIHAFYLMFANKVSAVAIVDAKGELVANLSASDVRGLHAENFTKLLLPVSQFLKSQHNRKAPVTVTLNTTLETVLHKLVWFRLHRVWIVDESNKPIGVISLTDIMNIFNVTD